MVILLGLLSKPKNKSKNNKNFIKNVQKSADLTVFTSDSVYRISEILKICFFCYLYFTLYIKVTPIIDKITRMLTLHYANI